MREYKSPVGKQKNCQSSGYCENTKGIQPQYLQKMRKALKVKISCIFTVVEIKDTICKM